MSFKKWFVMAGMLFLFLSSCSYITNPNHATQTASDAFIKKEADDEYIQLLLVLVDSSNTTNQINDDIFYVQFHPYKEEVKLVSFMPDTIVTTENNETLPIKEVYIKKGINELQSAIYKTYNIPFDNFVVIDYIAFHEAIKRFAPEGLDVVLTEDQIQSLSLPYNAGAVTLADDELIQFIRSEFHNGTYNNQMELTERLITLISEKMYTMEGIGNFIATWNTTHQYITTDITMVDIVEMSTASLYNNIPTITSFRVTAESSYETVYAGTNESLMKKEEIKQFLESK